MLPAIKINNVLPHLISFVVLQVLYYILVSNVKNLHIVNHLHQKHLFVTKINVLSVRKMMIAQLQTINATYKKNVFVVLIIKRV